MTSSTKPEVHYNYIALPSEEDQAIATNNMHRKFGEICALWLILRYMSGQTVRQTDTLTAILCTAWGRCKGCSNASIDKNSSGDEIANVNFLRRYGTYVLQNTKKENLLRLTN